LELETRELAWNFKVEIHPVVKLTPTVFAVHVRISGLADLVLRPASGIKGAFDEDVYFVPVCERDFSCLPDNNTDFVDLFCLLLHLGHLNLS